MRELRASAQLVHQQRPDITYGRHVSPRKQRPPPAVGLATDNRKRCCTLQATGIENQQAEDHRQGIDGTTVRPCCRLQARGQRGLICRTTDCVYRTEDSNDDFPGRKSGNDGGRDFPVPAERLERGSTTLPARPSQLCSSCAAAATFSNCDRLRRAPPPTSLQRRAIVAVRDRPQ